MNLIFDMDGTIIDSMPAHRQAWLDFAQGQGLTQRAAELEQATTGCTGLEAMRALFGPSLTLAQAQQHVAQKEQLYRAAFAGSFRWIDGFLGFARHARAQGWRCGLGTAGDRHNIDFVLQRLPEDLQGLFEVCVGGDQGLPGKPDPAIFLAVAQGLGVPPETCWVFEDSPAGIASAGRAGMSAVGVLSGHSASELAGQHVAGFVSDYRDMAALEALLKNATTSD